MSKLFGCYLNGSKISKEVFFNSPEKYLGANWQNVLGFWNFCDSLPGYATDFLVDEMISNYHRNYDNLALKYAGELIPEESYLAITTSFDYLYIAATFEVISYHKIIENNQPFVHLQFYEDAFKNNCTLDFYLSNLRITEEQFLIKPEFYLGPNWRKVIEFWDRQDMHTIHDICKLGYACIFIDEEYDRHLEVLSRQVIGSENTNYVMHVTKFPAHSTLEMIVTHFPNVSMVYQPIFNAL